jgi:hypothetical protein
MRQRSHMSFVRHAADMYSASSYGTKLISLVSKDFATCASPFSFCTCLFSRDLLNVDVNTCSSSSLHRCQFLQTSYELVPKLAMAAAREFDARAARDGIESIAPLYGLPVPMKVHSFHNTPEVSFCSSDALLTLERLFVARLFLFVLSTDESTNRAALRIVCCHCQ